MSRSCVRAAARVLDQPHADVDAVDARDLRREHGLDRIRQVIVQARLGVAGVLAEAQHHAEFVRLDPEEAREAPHDDARRARSAGRRGRRDCRPAARFSACPGCGAAIPRGRAGSGRTIAVPSPRVPWSLPSPTGRRLDYSMALKSLLPGEFRASSGRCPGGVIWDTSMAFNAGRALRRSVAERALTIGRRRLALTIGHEIERRVIVRPGRMRLSRAPSRHSAGSIGGKARITLRARMDLRDLQPVRERHRLRVDVRAADHHDGVGAAPQRVAARRLQARLRGRARRARRAP